MITFVISQLHVYNTMDLKPERVFHFYNVSLLFHCYTDMKVKPMYKPNDSLYEYMYM